MKIIRNPIELLSERKHFGSKSVGFVPTMGALHEGHKSLLTASRAVNEISVLSIFVNPTQFNDPQDFAKYPITWDADLDLAEKSGVDLIFAPTKEDMYPDGYKYQVIETEFSKTLCGRDRPGHFDGVLSVVMKLFLLIRPTHAYFGEKDFQQLTLIQKMVDAFFLDVVICPMPTLREPDGLALSSRNVRLTKEERLWAPEFYRALIESKSDEEARARLKSQNINVDYVFDFQGRRFGAIRLGAVRLIDNVALG